MRPQSRLFSPIQLYFAETYCIANFDACFFQGFRYSHFGQCDLQTVHTFFTVLVSHAHGAHDALAMYDKGSLFFCNAIHLVPDKPAVLAHIAEALAPGGLFACNSAFFAGTYVPGTERFYQLFLRGAVGWLRREYPQVRLSREGKALARQWLSPDEYGVLLRQE